MDISPSEYCLTIEFNETDLKLTNDYVKNFYPTLHVMETLSAYSVFGFHTESMAQDFYERVSK